MIDLDDNCNSLLRPSEVLKASKKKNETEWQSMTTESHKKLETQKVTKDEFRCPASTVVDFYKDRCIFITGATGFMGKVLVYKLLKSCPGIKRIYLLIRPKRDLDPQARLQELLKVPIFLGLSQDVLAKVTLVSGDVSDPNLGLSKKDEQTMVDSVSVVFHVAATVRFDDDLTKSIELNIIGTQRVVELARKLKHLAAFVHTSTAFSHCYLDTIEEKFYPLPSLSTVIDLYRLAQENPSLLDILNQPDATRAVIGSHPNSYTFTKALAEQFIFDQASDLPVVIVRPSIVIASWKEPMPGWIDNLNGPTGIICGCYTGLLRSCIVDEDKVADFIPVDIAINLMCVVASRVGLKQGLPVEPEGGSGCSIPIYHVTSGELNPMTWYEFREYSEVSGSNLPMMKMIWYPGVVLLSNVWLHWLCFCFTQKLPAFFLDLLLQVFGYKPFLKRLNLRMEKTMAALDFFVHREWHWDMTNFVELEKSLEAEDKEIFPLNLQDMDWVLFVQSYFFGARTYVLKEDPSNLRLATVKFYILWILQHLFIATCIGGAISLFSIFDSSGVTSDLMYNWIQGLICAVIIIYHGMPSLYKDPKYAFTEEKLQSFIPK